jgi:biotin carboxylase
MPPPPPFGDERGRRIAAFVQGFLSALGVEWGTAHTEVKISAGGRIGIIESQTRVGGDRIWEMTQLTTGVDQIGAALRSLHDADVTVPHLPGNQRVVVFACILAPPGRVREVADSMVLAAIDGVLDVSIHVEPGQELTPLIDNEHRRGHVFIQGESHDEVFKTMRAVSELFWVTYEDGTVWHPTFGSHWLELPEPGSGVAS